MFFHIYSISFVHFFIENGTHYGNNMEPIGKLYRAQSEDVFKIYNELVALVVVVVVVALP